MAGVLMSKVSLELVPRDEAALREELAQTKKYEGKIDLINVPDLLRLPMRSWEGAAIAGETFPAVPHIRAMDIDITKPLPMADYLREHAIREVLVIEGDAPQNMAHTVYPTESIDVIRKFREEMPEIRVFAGIDQYRGSMRQEDYRIRRKLQVGAVGFFTQPFFDRRFLAMYADMLEGIEVYWGLSPVTSQRSESYWETKNQVVFPKDFEPTLAWSIAFARDVLAEARTKGEHVYLMPIRTGIDEYLGGIFAEG